MFASQLSLESKGLTEIPSYVFDMPDLKILSLKNNRIRSIPSRDIAKLHKLVGLLLDDNQLTSLPDTIGTLKNLVTLDVYNNQLTSLPESIGNLKTLENVSIRNNKLESLPESIGKLNNLGVLIIDGNRLTSLPESIGQLKKLRRLYVSNNRLTTLPESIGNLKNLIDLRLTGNTLTSLPESFKKVSPRLDIHVSDRKSVKRDAFINLFKRPILRINNSTNFINRDIMNTRLGAIPINRRAFINTNSNVKNNGTLRRVYNIEGLNKSLRGKNSTRLHGGTFTRKNITLLKNVPHTVNKRAYLRNIKNRLANTALNNLNTTVIKIKNALPQNVSRNDVNQIVRGMKSSILQKVGNRGRLLTTLRTKGL